MGLDSEATEFDGQRIIAIQDMNNDKQADLITINTDATTITVHYFNEADQKYTTTAEFQVTTSGKIQSVVPTKT